MFLSKMKLFFFGPKPDGDCLNCRSLTPAWACREPGRCDYKPVVMQKSPPPPKG